MGVKLQAASNGTVELVPANTASNFTVTVPAATGTMQVSGSPISGTTGSFSGDMSFNSGYGSAAVAYGCRAWVNFNGTGTVAIRASGNVSSITDNGTGNYTVNFTTAMPDGNYACLAMSNLSGGTNGYVRMTVAPTTSAANFECLNNTASAYIDPQQVYFAVFR